MANHLSRSIFCEGSGMELSTLAIQWLVSSCSAQNRTRLTPQGVYQPLPQDLIYARGRTSDRCTLVLQGRLSLNVGQESFLSEAGAFTLLGKDALYTDRVFIPDYTASVSTPHVRLLTITKAKFLEAQVLDTRKASELEEVLHKLRAEQSGETSRMEARQFRDRASEGSPCSNYSRGFATSRDSTTPCCSPLGGENENADSSPSPRKTARCPERKKTQTSM